MNIFDVFQDIEMFTYAGLMAISTLCFARIAHQYTYVDLRQTASAVEREDEHNGEMSIDRAGRPHLKPYSINLDNNTSCGQDNPAFESTYL